MCFSCPDCALNDLNRRDDVWGSAAGVEVLLYGLPQELLPS